MPASPLSVVVQHLMADVAPGGGGMTDGELLARFLSTRDHDALAALVRRHAPMVWGVCGRLLHNHHDAEDAFQATFLVLVRKAAAVPGQAVAGWLHGVARQTAVRVRATAAKRGRRETQVVTMPEPTVAEVRAADGPSAAEEELGRLPGHYRGVIVLCDLEGLSRREAARQLAIPEGSVASRLARARAMLVKRLARRGVAFSVGSVAAVFSAGSASGSAPPALVASTIEAAARVAAGRAATGVISARVAALTEGVINAMLIAKIRGVVALALVACTLAAGVTALAFGQPVEPRFDPRGHEPKHAGPLEAVAASRFEGHSDGVMVVAFSPDGKRALSGGVCYGDRDPTVRLWDVVTGKEQQKLEGHTGGVYSLAFLPGGKTAVSGGADGTLRIWDLDGGKELNRYEGHAGTVYGLDVSRDGKLLLTGGEDSTMRLWDLESGKEVRRFAGHEGRVRAVAFSADVKQAVSGTVLGDATVRVWDVETGKELSKYTVASTPARNRRGVGVNKASGIGPLVPGGFGPGGFGPFPFPDEPGGIASVALSPDGKLVLAGCTDNVLRVYELSTGKERKLEGHTRQLHGAVFTPDGKRILSGSYDQTVRLWDVESGKEVGRFLGHTNWVWGVAVSPDGKLGLSGSLDKTVRLWKLPR
jgi:RNA polymerase sigma factor (sigma-70 family)